MGPMNQMVIETTGNANLSDNATSDTDAGMSQSTYVVRIVFAVAMIVFSIAGFFGNTLIVLTIALVRSLRTTRNAFLANLAISDVTLIVIVVPFNIISVLQGEPFWRDRMSLCQFVAAICAPGCLAAIWSNTGVAFSRYVFICRNESYHKYFAGYKTFIWILALWALSFGIHLPNHVGWGRDSYVKHFFLCTRETKLASYSFFFSAAGIVLPLAISFFAYCRIYALVRTTKSARNHILGHASSVSQAPVSTIGHTMIEKDQITGSGIQSIALPTPNQLTLHRPKSQSSMEPSVQQRFRAEIRLVKTLFRSFAVFVVAWLPLALLLMLPDLEAPTWVYLLTVFLAHGSTATNSILYFMTNDDFRRGFCAVVKTVARNHSTRVDVSGAGLTADRRLSSRHRTSHSVAISIGTAISEESESMKKHAVPDLHE